MSSFLSKLFGNARQESPGDDNGLKTIEQPKAQHKAGRREPPVELDVSRCSRVRLPLSPNPWEVDGRDEFHTDFKDPTLGPIFSAGFAGQFAKVIKLASDLTLEQRHRRVGEVIANAYAKTIIRRMKAGQFTAAAKLCLEMFEAVPSHVDDVDRRRFNRILVQIDKDGKKHDFTPIDVSATSSQPVFTLSGNVPWTLHGERKLTPKEKSALAFDLLSVDSAGSWQIAHVGAGQSTQHVLRRADRHGNVLGEKKLGHDVYRKGASAAGVAIMDPSGMLHVYDANLNIVTVSTLQDDPRIVDHFRTIKTNYWGEFKSQVRAVDFSPTGDRYLFTLADEAWCCDPSGKALWGVSTPLKPGWGKANGRGNSAPKVSPKVDNALRELGLSVPTTPVEVKQQYRRLALKNHPDRNPGNEAVATERMKAVNTAFEVLTGVDPTTLDFEDPSLTHFVRTSPDGVFEAGGTRFEVTISDGVPQDWIYAAKFTDDGGAYLGAYSGLVIQVSPLGVPIRVFETKANPSALLSAGSTGLFLTPTRLHVINSGMPVTCIDAYRQGEPFATSSGFGLLGRKKLQWFNLGGEKVGELNAKDSIRAIHQTNEGVIVRTRQYEVEVRGLVVWASKSHLRHNGMLPE